MQGLLCARPTIASHQHMAHSGTAIVVTITGSPCSGKTNALPIIRQELESRGYYVIIVPEAATNVLKDCTFGNESNRMLQQRILCEQTRLESVATANFTRVSNSLDAQVVILKDRCAADGIAFCSEETWGHLTGPHDKQTIQRHAGDVVVLMETAPCCNYEYGPRCENPIRYHNHAEALQVQSRLYELYSAMQVFHVVHSTAHPADKYNRTAAQVVRSIRALERFSGN